MNVKPNYWIVGAMWGGWDDQHDEFVRDGIWYLGWDDSDQPAQAAKRDQIRPGDFIAIKRMLGRGSGDIEIRSVGKVMSIDPDKTVHVEWFAPNVQRRVPSRGCYASIHGPFDEGDPWVKRAFSPSPIPTVILIQNGLAVMRTLPPEFKSGTATLP